ncbi:MAG: hypothetical protein QM802_19845 [Agriterribacter sp.]
MFSRSVFAKMLTGPNNTFSSKRGGLYLFSIIWVIGFLVNLFTGKIASETYRDENFQLILAFIAVVFGDNIVKANKDINMKRADNPPTNINANVTKADTADVVNVNVPEQKAE